MVKETKFQLETATRHANPRGYSRSEKGQGLIEYTLIIVLFSLVTLVGLSAMGVNLGAAFNQIVNAFNLSPQDEEPIVEEDPILQVRVVNPSNEGVPNVQVYVYQNGKTYNDLSGTTDAYGQIEFELDTGSYSFMAFYQLQFFTSGTYTLPGETIAVIQVSPNDFPVRVITEAGAGIPDVKIMAYRDDGAYAGMKEFTNSLGVASFSMLEGDFKFRASYQGDYYWSAVYSLPEALEGTIETHRQPFPVRVQDLAGNPMEDLYVGAYRESDTYANANGRTGADGIVQLELAEGRFKFRTPYMNEVYWSDVVNVHAIGGATLTIPQADFKVRVVDSKGKGISNAGVYGYREDGSTYVDRYDRTDKDGFVTFTLVQGAFKFRAAYQDNDFWSEVVNVPTDGEAVIQTGQADFPVKVVDSDGAGIANITLATYNPGGKYLGIIAVTDNEGIAYLPVSYGSFIFKAVVKGTEYWSDKVTTTQDKSVTIKVSATAGSQKYTISLINQKNKSLAGADVYVRDANDEYTGVSGTTDSDGQITLELAPGTYSFRVDYEKKSWVSSEFSFPDSDPLTIKVPVK